MRPLHGARPLSRFLFVSLSLPLGFFISRPLPGGPSAPIGCLPIGAFFRVFSPRALTLLLPSTIVRAPHGSPGPAAHPRARRVLGHRRIRSREEGSRQSV